MKTHINHRFVIFLPAVVVGGGKYLLLLSNKFGVGHFNAAFDVGTAIDETVIDKEYETGATAGSGTSFFGLVGYVAVAG